jgi:hypothetical protein
MEDENNSSVITLSINLIQAYLKRLNDIAHLVNLEAKLALRTLIVLVSLAVVLLLLLLSSWLSLLALLFVTLLKFHYSLLTTSAAITVLNLILLLCTYAYMHKLKQYLLFPATRRQISETLQLSEESKNEQPATGN